MHGEAHRSPDMDGYTGPRERGEHLLVRAIATQRQDDRGWCLVREQPLHNGRLAGAAWTDLQHALALDDVERHVPERARQGDSELTRLEPAKLASDLTIMPRDGGRLFLDARPRRGQRKPLHRGAHVRHPGAW